MNLSNINHIDRDELLRRLKQTRLKGFGQPLIYEHATLELAAAVDTDRLVPAQRYVLSESVGRILGLRTRLLARDLDIFRLEGGLLLSFDDDPGAEIPLLPPIIEESREPGGRTVWLINDGMHRVYAARKSGLPINVVLARGVPEDWPYYAYALEQGWADVQALDELPDNFLKKTYRNPDNYKSLFRDFNAVFPRIQEQRKQSNPAHIRA
jgi:hypothetical protein